MAKAVAVETGARVGKIAERAALLGRHLCPLQSILWRMLSAPRATRTRPSPQEQIFSPAKVTRVEQEEEKKKKAREKEKHWKMHLVTMI